MTTEKDGGNESGNDGETPGDPVDPENTPTVSCENCSREWSLDYELEELHAGNTAVEQFAMDHARHTGHYPDDVTPYIADCCNCIDGESFLSERPARRWAEVHARHTNHTVELSYGDSSSEIESPGED
ncbi:MAG: hypothetical protein ABEK59_10675 [Halobacteria archaeon]